MFIWFAKDASKAKANNARVLKRYSESMEALLKSGYQYRVRPSGHDITAKFSRRNEGAIPPNLLGFTEATDVDTANEMNGNRTVAVGEEFDGLFPNLLALSNTGSNTQYQRECIAHGIKPHPARFPIGLPAFFIEFLTDPGDVICDPFAGSNTTGEAAQALNRRWISCDLDDEGQWKGTYVRTSAFRFKDAKLTSKFDYKPTGDYETAALMAPPAEQTILAGIADVPPGSVK